MIILHFHLQTQFKYELFHICFTSFQLVLKKDTVPTILTSLWQVASRHLEKKTITKQANNACRTAGELLGHFPKKIRFVFRSKTFPKNDALTQKRSNVQDDSDVVKDSFSSTPSGQFRSIFVELSAVFLVLTFLLLFTTQPKEKFSHQFLLQCLLNI